MQKNIVNKGLSLAVIILFIGVNFQPVFAKDTISPGKKSDTKDLLETLLDIVDNKEILKIIQKYEYSGNLLESQYLKVNLQKEITGFIIKNDVLNGRLKQLSDLPCDCENNITFPWHFPVLCLILFPIIYVLGMSAIVLVLVFNYPFPNFIWHLYEILFLIAYKFNCPYLQF